MRVYKAVKIYLVTKRRTEASLTSIFTHFTRPPNKEKYTNADNWRNLKNPSRISGAMRELKTGIQRRRIAVDENPLQLEN